MVCAAPHGSVNIDCGAVYRIALTVILEVGSVAEEGVEVHELECGPQVVLRE